MPNNQTQSLENGLKAMVSALENYSSKDDIERVFTTLLGIMGDLKEWVEAKASKSESEMSDITKMCDGMHASISEIENEIHKISVRGEQDTNSLKQLILSETNKLRSLIPALPDLSSYDRKLAEIEEKIPTLPERDTPIELRNSLESIKNDNDKLSIEAIGYLRQELDKLEKKIGTAKSVTIFGGNNAGLKNSFKDIDISTSLDGNISTFNIPAVWYIISVSLSSFPYGAARKGIDYTWTPTSITFTSEIDPATQLAAGQKCILTVVTA